MASVAVSSSVVAIAPAFQTCGQNVGLSSRTTVFGGPGRSVSRKFVANKTRIVMSAGSSKVRDLGGPTAIALLAAAIIPEIAEAAQPGVSPSLKNLLLSVVAGGVVLSGIGVAVAGVSTFDPVKRR